MYYKFNVPTRTPPLQDPILSFSHTFSLKSAHIGGQNPPKMGPRPPLRKILNSALQ